MRQSAQARDSSSQRQDVRTRRRSLRDLVSATVTFWIQDHLACSIALTRSPFVRGSVPVMLRLRPSELTLTPEDVDETLRRMAHRQALHGSRHVSAQLGRPSLHRGPQRAIRDAITTLGDIPILRPQPQQAIFTSVDDDMESDPEQQTPSPTGRVDGVSGSMPVRGEQTLPGTVAADASPALRTMHLPIRPGRNLGGSPTASPFLERHLEAATASRRHPPPLPEEDTNGNQTVQHSLPTRLTTSSSTPELRGGGGGPKKGRTHTASQSHDFASSRPQQGLILRPVNDQADADPDATDSEPTATGERSALNLQGHFTDSNMHPLKLAYDFLENPLQAPQTEPRRASRRHAMPARSLSSSAAPAFAKPTQLPAIASSSADDGFGNHAEGRQFSSETSATSAPYSIYDLPPESRQSSGERSASAQYRYLQCDGSTASGYANRGAYRSVRPPDLQPHHDSLQHPARGFAYASQHSISPLPSMPYTRAKGTHATPQSFSGHHLPSFVPLRPMDAATAAVHDLASPLEPFADHYRSLNAHAAEWHPTSAQFSDIDPTNSFGGAGAPVTARNNITNQQNMSRSQLGRPNSGQPQQHPAVFQYSPVDIFQYLPPGTATGPPAGAFAAPPRLPSQPTGRAVQATRAYQRSRENAPVRPLAHSSGPSGNSQVQVHRAAFERLHNVNITTTGGPQQGASRHSLPQPAAPRITSGGPQAQPSLHRVPGYSGHPEPRRRTPQTSSNSTQARQQPSSSQGGTTSPAGIPQTSSRTLQRPAPSNEPDMRGGGVRRRITPAAPSSSLLQPPRNYPSGSIAPSRTSVRTTLRSPVLRATTSARPLRRVPPQQRDQENSGAGEEQLMRQEEAAINARYGEDFERDTMDETPPRVGRVERRIFS
jgi:hypothetical protein